MIAEVPKWRSNYSTIDDIEGWGARFHAAFYFSLRCVCVCVLWMSKSEKSSVVTAKYVPSGSKRLFAFFRIQDPQRVFCIFVAQDAGFIFQEKLENVWNGPPLISIVIKR